MESTLSSDVSTAFPAVVADRVVDDPVGGGSVAGDVESVSKRLL